MKLFIQFFLIIIIFSFTLKAQKSLIWVGSETYKQDIKIANIDGSGVRNFFNVKLKEPEKIAVDKVRKRLYWYDRDLFRIVSSDFDGNNLELIFSEYDSLKYPGGLSIDELNQKLYVTEPSISKIFKSNLDGTSKEYLSLNHAIIPKDIVIDNSQSKIYWLEQLGTIFRVCSVNIDSNQVNIIIDTTLGYNSTQSLAIDEINQKMYWIMLSNGNLDDKIFRANTDGSNIEEIVNNSNGLVSPIGITVDNINNKIYWTDSDAGGIFKANLDGSNIEIFEPFGEGNNITSEIEYVEQENEVFWADPDRGLFSKRIDSEFADTLMLNNYVSPSSLQYDFSSKKLYWADILMNYISCGDFNNSIQHILGENGYGPSGLALDTIAKKIYWNIQWTNQIKRCNYDGTQIETFLNLSSFPTAYYMAINSEQRLLYFSTDNGDIYKSNLDLSNDIDFFIQTNGGWLGNMIFDNTRNKIYWSDSNPVSIRVADFDGQNMTTIVSGEDSIMHISGLCLDLESEHIYWSDNTIHKIQRSDLNGENIEDVITNGLENVSGLILINNPITDINVSPKEKFDYVLHQNYPNPFNPSTKISYSIPKSAKVTIKIFDVLGKEVDTLIDDFQESGNHSLSFNGKSLSSGVYFYRLQTEDFSVTKKFVLLK